ncbi:MAG: LysE family transporter [Candidatus Microthrix sp.]|nr:LysE family transporter [Candidatus Microthrix sp.]
MNGLIVGFTSSLPLLLIVGPVSLMVLDTGLTTGVRGGWPAPLGVAGVDLAYASATAAAGLGLQRLLNEHQQALGWGGGLALMVLAAYLLTHARSQRGGADSVGPTDSAPAPMAGAGAGAGAGADGLIRTTPDTFGDRRRTSGCASAGPRRAGRPVRGAVRHQPADVGGVCHAGDERRRRAGPRVGRRHRVGIRAGPRRFPSARRRPRPGAHPAAHPPWADAGLSRRGGTRHPHVARGCRVGSSAATRHANAEFERR